MLFTQHINTLTARVDNIQTQIEELESQLRTLRSHKASFEAELQQILTLEGAAESALSQSQSFINAAESLGRYDLIETFWQALNTMQNGAIATLPEAPEPDATPESEPDAPTPDGSQVIQVEIATPLETLESEDIEITDTEADELMEDVVNALNEADAIDVQPMQPLSVGSAAFNPSDASLDDLKRYVRSYQVDDKTRLLGTLNRRSTWETAARSILING